MKRINVKWSGNLQSVEVFEGEYIEQKIERIMNNGEPITDGAPLIYTEKKDGVLPAYNIRTDRFDIAIDAMEKVEKIKAAKRDAKPDIEKVPDKLDGGTPSEN